MWMGPRRVISNFVEYTADDVVAIRSRIAQIMEANPDITELRSAVWEVVNRVEGDNGLTSHRVDYLTDCIIIAVKEHLCIA